MIEKGKISAFQMALMMYPTIVGTVILSVPGVVANYAKNDLWISPIWASFGGFLAVYLAFQLHKLYPGQTIIQYSGQIIGRIPGKLLGFLYLFFYVQMNGHGIRIYADFITGAFLPQTPISVVIATMIIACAFAVRAGLEGLGRATQLFLPIYVFSLIIIIILLLQEIDPKNFFPVLEHGLMPSLKGAVVPQGWFAEYLLVSFLLPFLTDAEKGRKWGMISVFAVMLTLVVTNLIILFIFGGSTADYVYPLMNAAKYISIAEFAENLESVLMAMWVLGNFIKFSVVHYSLVIGTAQWLNLSDYRPITLPLGLLTMLFSFWSMPSQLTLSNYLTFGFSFFSPSFQLLIPLLLLIIAVLRERNRQKSQSAISSGNK